MPVPVARRKHVKSRSGGCLVWSGDRKPTVWLTVGTTVTLYQIPNAGNLCRISETKISHGILKSMFLFFAQCARQTAHNQLGPCVPPDEPEIAADHRSPPVAKNLSAVWQQIVWYNGAVHVDNDSRSKRCQSRPAIRHDHDAVDK